MHTTPTSSQPCPSCTYELSADTGIEDPSRLPKNGDFSLCFNCGCLLQYGLGQGGRLYRYRAGESELRPHQRQAVLKIRQTIFEAKYGGSQ